MNTVTEEQVEALKRAGVTKAIVQKLIQLTATQGLSIALGIYIDVAKHFGLPADRAARCVSDAWDADKEDFKVPR